MINSKECYLNKMPQDIIEKIGEYHPIEKDSFLLRWAVQKWPGLHDLFQLIIDKDLLSEDTIKNIIKFTDFDIDEFDYTQIDAVNTIIMRRRNIPTTIEEGITNTFSATKKFAEIYGYEILDIKHHKPYTATVGYNVLTHNINITVKKKPIFPIAQKLNVLSKATSKYCRQPYVINYEDMDININSLEIC